MSKNKSRFPKLGRGLSTLMAKPVVESTQDEAPIEVAASPPTGSGSGSSAQSTGTEAAAGQVIEIPVDAIQPSPHQPRRHFDQAALNKLAESIRSVGLLQPVIVCSDNRGSAQTKFGLVAGERRWRAAQIAGLSTLPAIVRDPSDGSRAEWALIENLQREDLNSIERAHGFEHLINEFGLNHEEVAKHVGIDRTTITNSLRLLNLDPDIQLLIHHGAISGGQAKALAGVTDSQAQIDLAKQAVQLDWSVRQLEAAARKIAKEQRPSPAAGPGEGEAAPNKRTAHLADLEHQISEQLGTKVRIRPGRKKGTGTLSIDFYDLDQFDALLTRFGVETQ